MLTCFKVQVLGKEELSAMNKTISIIQVEESRRVVMLEPQSEEGSTMISINTGGKEAKSNDDGQIVGKLATNSMGDHQILISHKDTTRMEASGMDNIMYKHIYLMVKPLLTRSLAVKRLSLANKTLAG
ncbi:hypothetical protein CK203_006673 [Vitis vinifera]|uniref:Uncharacterized protein n=1 Tax=Vitis vinifera TaxID=29760 RepID=A0A438KAZ5_VITVI|nr:hypothetical protein CK203_006673 [Vitis vinifera]